MGKPNKNRKKKGAEKPRVGVDVFKDKKALRHFNKASKSLLPKSLSERRRGHARRGEVEKFVALLDRCKAQVEADPSGILNNPHLYGALHHIYLRLCHGNIPEYAAGGKEGES